MARLFVTGINLNKNELQNARIHNLSSAPSSPVAGQIYFDTTANVLYFYNGTAWVPASGSTEVIQDVIGSSVIGGTGLTATYDDAGTGNTTIDLDNTAVTAGNYGTTAAKTASFTVDAQGRLTAASEQNIQIATSQVTDLAEFIDDTVADAVTGLVKEGEGIDVTYDDAGGTLTIAGEDASTTNKGIASFNADDFNVTTGAVELEDTVVKSVTTDSGALTPSSHGFSILGGEGVDVTHAATTITVAAEDATSSNKGIASFDGTDFTVTSGAVTLNVDRIEDVAANLIVAGTGLDKNYNDGAGTLTIDIDSTVTTNDGAQNLTNKTLGSGTILSADLNANSNKITNLAAPTNAGDAANKAYVDGVAEGLHIHAASYAATTANLNATYSNGTSGVGATLTNAGTQAAFTTDGVSPAINARILVKSQTNTFENGIYTLTTVGTVSTNWVLTRATDFDTALEMAGGDFTFVDAGTTLANTGWVMVDEVTTVGTDPVVFQQFSGAGVFLAGDGLTLTGSTFSVDVTPTSGNASLTNTGGAVEVKVNTNDGLEVTASGLGINNGTGLTFSGGALVFDTANGYGTRKLAFAVGNGSATSYTVNHALATRDVSVQVYENSSPYAQVEADVEHTDSNNLTIKFAVAPTSDQYRVVVVG
jgi:hypothetical protein